MSTKYKSPTERELFVTSKQEEQEEVVMPSPDALKNASIASTIMYGLDSIKLQMTSIRGDILRGGGGRDAMQNLKDCMMMLFELRDREKEFLESLTEEELKKLVE